MAGRLGTAAGRRGVVVLGDLDIMEAVVVLVPDVDGEGVGPADQGNGTAIDLAGFRGRG